MFGSLMTGAAAAGKVIKDLVDKGTGGKVTSGINGAAGGGSNKGGGDGGSSGQTSYPNGYTTKYTGGNASLDNALKGYSDRYNTARAQGDWQGMREASDGANQIRNQFGFAAEDASKDISYIAAQYGGTGGGSSGYSPTGGGQQVQQPQQDNLYADLLEKYQREQAAIQAQQEAAKRAAVEQAVGQLSGQKSGVEQSYQDLYRQLYLDRRMAEKNLPQQMAVMGYNGGLTESTAMGLQTSYSDALRQGEQAKTGTLSDIDRAISDARLSGDISIAEQAAALAQQGLASYADIVAAMQQQQNWTQQFGYQQAQDERNYNYQVGRDQVSDSQWNQTWSRQQLLDEIERSDVDYNRKLELANLLYQNSGDASGYSALGLGANEIAGLQSSYAAAMTSGSGSGSGGRSGSSGNSSGSGSGMNLTTAKLYANNGIWGDEVLDVFRKNGYSDALLAAEYGYKPTSDTGPADTGGMNGSYFNAMARSLATQMESGNTDTMIAGLDGVWAQLSATQKQTVQELLKKYGYEYRG